MWKMVLWGATFNAVVAIGMVSLLLFRLPLAILRAQNYFFFLCSNLGLRKVFKQLGISGCELVYAGFVKKNSQKQRHFFKIEIRK